MVEMLYRSKQYRNDNNKNIYCDSNGVTGHFATLNLFSNLLKIIFSLSARDMNLYTVRSLKTVL